MVEVVGGEEEGEGTMGKEEGEEPYDETGTRWTWELLTWIVLALSLLLNLILIGLLVFRRNLHSLINKCKTWFVLENEWKGKD
jgi:hypothetical protein